MRDGKGQRCQPRLKWTQGLYCPLSVRATYCNLWQSNQPQLHTTEKVLSTYTGESLEVLGSLSVLVEYGEQKSQLDLPHKRAATVCIPWYG